MGRGFPVSFGQEGLPLSSLYEAWFIKFARDVFARKPLLKRDGESVRWGTWKSVTLSATVSAAGCLEGPVGDGRLRRGPLFQLTDHFLWLLLAPSKAPFSSR